MTNLVYLYTNVALQLVLENYRRHSTKNQCLFATSTRSVESKRLANIFRQIQRIPE